MSTVAKSEGRGSLFDNKQMVHIASEVVVLLGITLYFSSKNKKLMNHIEELAQRLEQQDDRIQSLENSQKQNGQYIMKVLMEKLEQTNARITQLVERVDALQSTASVPVRRASTNDAERTARLQRILKRAEAEETSVPLPQPKTVFRPSSRNPSHLEPVTELPNEEELIREKKVQFNIPSATGSIEALGKTPVQQSTSISSLSSKPTIEDDDSDGDDSELDQEIQSELEELKNSNE